MKVILLEEITKYAEKQGFKVAALGAFPTAHSLAASLGNEANADDRNFSAQAPDFRHGDKPLVCYNNKKIVGASTIGGELVRPEESGKFEDTRIPRLQSWGVCQLDKCIG